MLRGKERAPPGPTYMSDEQKADYLQNLRSSHVSRPSGSRPPPPSKYLPRRAETETSTAAWSNARPSLQASSSMPVAPPAKINHTRTESAPVAPKVRFAGRPIVREPLAPTQEVEQSSPIEEQPMGRKSSMSYIERGSRWMEKQEMHSLRRALEDMDMEEEKKVHSAAQDEAAELVWKHQNPEDPSTQPGAPYANPDVRKDYHSHLRKGSYRRSLSQDFDPAITQRKTSGGSHDDSIHNSITSNKRRSIDATRKVSPPSNSIVIEKRRTPSGKSYGGLAEAVADDIARAHRRSSSGSRRILSGEKKKMYMHPNDRIWEDPQEDQTLPAQTVVAPRPDIGAIVPPATNIRKNPFARVRMQAEKLERSRSEPIVTAPMHHSIEIQRNAPSQSRRPWYMSNEPLPPTPPSAGSQAADDVSPKVTPTKEGIELRGDDIRAATSKKRNDYSPKLPRPTVVSDKPGRPIVSFEKDWKPKEVVLEGVQAAPVAKVEAEPAKTRQPFERLNSAPTTFPRPRTLPQITVNEPSKVPTPTINLPDEPAIPTFVLPEEPVFEEPSAIASAPATPSISVDPPAISIGFPSTSRSRPDRPSSRPQPATQRPPKTTVRPLPHHSATSPLPMSRSHVTPVIRQSGTLCAQCALPIAGRILSAGGERFHPSCFVCYQCYTNLELVAFYPEPEKQASERRDRIAARQSGEDVEGEEGLTMDEALRLEAEDGDATPRFYCHLDFHELFSPRCKSCKTPIEGEVIVACGAEWHVGHFFCAQCGDPFDNKTPFVEKDGYAWCVGCHTNRYSSKCRKCKKPVTDTVVKALGHDWHANCFVCTECNGGFKDGRYFLRGASQDPVCVMCEERRLKA